MIDLEAIRARWNDSGPTGRYSAGTESVDIEQVNLLLDLLDFERIAAILGEHRWKSMGTNTVECECGQIIEGDGMPLTGFPADQAFRYHLADVLRTAPRHPNPLLARVIQELNGLMDSLDDHVIANDDERLGVYESLRDLYQIATGAAQ